MFFSAAAANAQANTLHVHTTAQKDRMFYLASEGCASIQIAGSPIMTQRAGGIASPENLQPHRKL